MKILVIGGGGREHAIVWKLSQSASPKKIYAIPGNPGIAQLAETIPIKVDDIPAILNFALKEKIDLTIVGPELPLSLGICDQFKSHGMKIFGPSQKASRIESSKAFSKELMVKFHIPTASSETFSSTEKAKEFLLKTKKPVVIKADGLAAGKGVVIAQSDQEALETIDFFMTGKSLGDAGNLVLIEEFLEGEELSFLAVTDGRTVLPFSTAQDHKKIYDGEKGPNTGGMGAYSPVPLVTPEIEGRIMNQVMIPAVRAMKREGCPFKGFLYGGLILTREGIKVLEFNARLGDPEAQAILPRLESDLVEIMEAVLEEKLSQTKIRWSRKSGICVVLASKGYPGPVQLNAPITGLESLGSEENACRVFHSGTEMKGETLLASGGRVLGVTAWADSLRQARDRAYQAISKIHFEGMQFRKDIGLKGLTQKGESRVP